MAKGRIEWGRLIKKLSPYTIQKGFRYLKHYGPKEFWIRLHERFEPEEVPYGPWFEQYRRKSWKSRRIGNGNTNQRLVLSFLHTEHRNYFCGR